MISQTTSGTNLEFLWHSDIDGRLSNFLSPKQVLNLASTSRGNRDRFLPLFEERIGQTDESLAEVERLMQELTLITPSEPANRRVKAFAMSAVFTDKWADPRVTDLLKEIFEKGRSDCRAVMASMLQATISQKGRKPIFGYNWQPYTIVLNPAILMNHYTGPQFLDLLKKGFPIPPNAKVTTHVEGRECWQGILDLGEIDFTKVQLPENVWTDGSVDIRNNHTFTELPSGWKIGTHLTISHCDEFSVFPENWKIKGDFAISACSKLTGLPESLQLPGGAMVGRVYDPVDDSDYRCAGNIYITQCPKLVATPSCFTSLKPFWDETTREVTIRETAIPQEVIDAMRRLEGVGVRV